MQPAPPAHPVAPAFVVPSVALPFEPPPTPPHAGALRDDAIAWAERHGLIGPRGRARLEQSALLDLAVALAGPAPLPGAAVLMDWFLWALVLDDRVDDGPWGEGGALRRFSAEVESIVGSGGGTDGRDPMLHALATDLWPRTRALGDTAWQVRLRRDLLHHLRAQQAVVQMRESGAACTVAEYTELRREAFGALLFFDLIEAADGAVPATDPCGEGCWHDLRALAADVIAWTNDIHSVAKDLVHGEPYNLVTLLAGEHRTPWQESLDTARDMIVAAADDFTARKLRHLAHLPSVSRTADQVARIGRLEQAMRASADWHAGVSRYHLQADGGPHSRVSVMDTSLTPPTLKSRAFEIDPYPLYRRLRDTMPIAYDEPTDTWLLSRHADVRAALTDPRFSNENYTWQIAPLLGHSIVSMDGQEHAAHRAPLTRAFRSRALTILQDSIDDVARGLVARLRGRGQVDLVAEFTTPLPIQVMARALGLPADTPEQVARLKRWCTVGFSYMGNYRQDPGLLTHGLTNRDDFYDYLQPHLDARRARPGNDLISALLTATVDGRPLSEQYVRGCCAILMTAGSETSHGTLANLITNVLEVPGLLNAIRTDPTAIDLALAETMRRDPALQLVLRQTREEVDLPSGRVPAGVTVACLIGSANRDPRRFPDPDSFALHRADGRLDREYGGAATHFAFGAGRHFCLGSHLARAEITTGLRLLIARYPRLRWAHGFRPEPAGFLNRCPSRLEVTL
ncbi:cytochrome P450 [Streptomyces sp. B15]|uniref:cytochrome P450 n=2 Tax=Streptomyces TaxID=1883 RepID=UPI001B38E304|nr:cytochrome P450 [Streptomyces sp. B15]MBQ1120658.1 cytochrome P450 [Streptomyces sp. B15]